MASIGDTAAAARHRLRWQSAFYGKALASRIYHDFKSRFVADWEIDSSMKEVEINLEAFNRETVIPAMERLKIELQNELDSAKADLEFLEWLPSNSDNFIKY